MTIKDLSDSELEHTYSELKAAAAIFRAKVKYLKDEYEEREKQLEYLEEYLEIVEDEYERRKEEKRLLAIKTK